MIFSKHGFWGIRIFKVDGIVKIRHYSNVEKFWDLVNTLHKTNIMVMGKCMDAP
jgi:hypothetical protein